MSKQPKLRVFAGPNGSGKTTLVQELNASGYYKPSLFINADELLREYSEQGSINLQLYLMNQGLDELVTLFKTDARSPEALGDVALWKRFSLQAGRLFFEGEMNAYIAADIATFLRNHLIQRKERFWFETVFSHPSKLEVMREAKAQGFRVYFYFVATDSPEINIDRVRLRVKKQGHPVPEEKIVSRYYRSLDLLLDAIKLSDRAYLFDNSGRASELICQVKDGTQLTMETDNVPSWFEEYVYNKIKNKK